MRESKLLYLFFSLLIQVSTLAIDIDCLDPALFQLIEDKLPKERFINEFKRAEANITDEDQNVAFITKGRSNPDSEVYIDVNLGILKELNDKVFQGDKDFVTALAHKHKQYLIRHLETTSVQVDGKDVPLMKLLSKAGDLDALYSDFKAVRFAFDKDSDEILLALNRAFIKAGNDFAKTVDELGLTQRLSLHSFNKLRSDPTLWHQIGVGESADRATLQARLAKTRTSNVAQRFEDNVQYFTEQLNKIENLRKKIINSPVIKDAPSKDKMFLTKTEDGVEITVPSAEIMSILRSMTDSKDANEYFRLFRKRFRAKFKVSIPDNLEGDAFIENLKEYYNKANIFEAPLYTGKREAIATERATHSIAGGDIAAQGARNLEALAYHLAKSNIESPGNVDAAVVAARKAEEEATIGLNLRSNQWQEAVLKEDIRTAVEIDGVQALRPLLAKENLTTEDVKAFVQENKLEKVYNIPRSFKSGDDSNAYPDRVYTVENVKNIAVDLLDTGHPSDFRGVFFNTTFKNNKQDIPTELLNKIQSFGEKIDKSGKEALTAHVNYDSIKDSTFLYKLEVDSSGKIDVNVVIAGDSLSDSEISTFEKILNNNIRLDVESEFKEFDLGQVNMVPVRTTTN